MANTTVKNPPLNSLQSMFNLGNQPKISGQCRQNLRFINQESSNARNRFRLRRAFGNRIIQHNSSLDYNILPTYTSKFPITPFRATFNAGDAFGSVNKAPWNALLHNGSNQINLPNHPGAGDGTHTIKVDDPLKGAYGGSASAYSGNPRFVYDGSDYARFKNYKLLTEITMILHLEVINIVHHNKHIDV